MSGTNSLSLWSIGGGGNSTQAFFPIIGTPPGNSTEARNQVTLRAAATYSNQAVYWVKSVSGAATLRFRNNGANGNQLCTYAADGVTSDATHSDSVTSGNPACYAYSAGGGLYGSYFASLQLNATTPYVLIGAGCDNTNSAGLNFSTSNQFCSMIGYCQRGVAVSSSQAGSRQPMEAAGVVSYFAINLSVAITGTATVHLEIGGSAVNSVISTTGPTGTVEDSTHTDTISAGNAVDISFISTTAVGSLGTWWFSFAGTLSAHDAASSYTVRQNNASTYIVALGGAMLSSGSGPGHQPPIAYAVTASQLRVVADSNSGSGTVKFYNNGSDGNQAITYSGTAGTFLDSTHTDSVTAGNTFAAHVGVTSTWAQSSIGVNLDDGSVTGGGATARHRIINI